MKAINREELAKHRHVNDCWLSVYGKVYDVTAYLDEHPGGLDVMLDVAGSDATFEFEDANHSPAARKLLGKFLIGELEEGCQALETSLLLHPSAAGEAKAAAEAKAGGGVVVTGASSGTLLHAEVVPLPSHITLLAKSGATVYLVGTAHVSQTSVEVVRRAVREYQPQVVAVELCEARRAMLFPLPPQDLSVGGLVKSVMSKENNFFSVLYAYFLASVSDKLHVVPGIEFRAAYEEAKLLPHKAQVKLIDRPVGITVARMWASLSTWDKVRLCYALIYDTISLPSGDDLKELVESLMEEDAMTHAIKEFAKKFPALMEPMLYERDRFLAYVLRVQANKLSCGERVVAVVGAGHVKGIVQEWDKEIDVEELVRLPAVSSLHPVLRLASGVGCCTIVYAVIYLCVKGSSAATRFALNTLFAPSSSSPPRLPSLTLIARS